MTSTPFFVRVRPLLLAIVGIHLSLILGTVTVAGQETQVPSAKAPENIAEPQRLHDESARLFDAGQYAQAAAQAERALVLREKIFGPEHLKVAETLNLLGKSLRESADFTRAKQALQRALNIREKTAGADHASTAETLNEIAELYGGMGDFAQAETLFMRAIFIYAKLGEEDPAATKAIHNLGTVYAIRGDLAQSEQLITAAMNVRMQKLGLDHRLTAESLDVFGFLLFLKGDVVNAEQTLQRALAIRENGLGPNHPDTADTLCSLSYVYTARLNLVQAEASARRAIAIREKALGQKHPDYASALTVLAVVLGAKGDAAGAEQNIERALNIREQVFGSEHILVGDALASLAAYKRTLAEAERLANRALNIREKTFGPYHLLVADSLSYLGGLYFSHGDYTKAQLNYFRAISIRQRTLGDLHPLVADSLLAIGTLLLAQGNVVQAEPALQRAGFIFEKVYGPEHPTLAEALAQLGEANRAKGDYVPAEQILARALAIREKLFPPDHILVARSINSLALTAYDKGDLTKARSLFERALAILQKKPDENQLVIGRVLNNLGTLHETQGNDQQAELYLNQAQVIADKNPAAQATNIALPHSRAVLYGKQGKYEQALGLFTQALTMSEKTMGRDHPSTARILSNIAQLYILRGDKARAIEALTRSGEIQERNLTFMLASGSERQKFNYVLTLLNDTFLTVSFHTQFAADDPQAARLSLTAILRRKARTLDSTSDQLSTLRRRASAGEMNFGPVELDMLNQLSTMQSQLSTLMLGGPGTLSPEQYQSTVGSLSFRIEQLQDAISRRGASLATKSVTIEQVQEALPPTAALVEYFSYNTLVGKKGKMATASTQRYVAYVLGKVGDPRWVELGEAATIDEEITKLLVAMRCPQTLERLDDVRTCPSIAQVNALSRIVHDRLMLPVRRLLGDSKHLLISTDGKLNLLPFAALVDETGQYLVEKHSLTYVTSGRDLMRMQTNTQSKAPPLIIADPAFDEREDVQASAASTTAPIGPVIPSISPPGISLTPPNRSADLVALKFGPLEGTANEARSLSAILKNARVLTRTKAGEAALKQIHAPSVLHIATHGFFLPDKPASSSGRTVGLGLIEANPRLIVSSELPLLRSGLALAGANLPPVAGAEDGILTALEATALDLSGTKLVVLSACETGIGSLVYGEGVMGLRRALVLAGSESQVMSLWQVADQPTSELMVAYYKRLLAGEGRTEAMRQVQLEMVRGTQGASNAKSRSNEFSGDYRHPYYWAAFIQSGDWRPFTTKAVPN